MNKNLERKFNTTAYIIIILVEIIYIYVTNNEDNLNDDYRNNLVKLGRGLSFLTSSYFIINALVGYKDDKSSSQEKQVIAALLAVIAAYIRTTITSDDITFR